MSIVLQEDVMFVLKLVQFFLLLLPLSIIISFIAHHTPFATLRSSISSSSSSVRTQFSLLFTNPCLLLPQGLVYIRWSIIVTQRESVLEFKLKLQR